LIAVFLGIVTFLLFANTLTFVGSAVSVPGEVVGLEREPGEDLYSPRVRFTTVGGRQVEFVSSMYSKPPGFHVGEQVTVRYSPGRPERAEVQSFFRIWGAVIISFFLFVMFAMAGTGRQFVIIAGAGRQT
jgi:hypothetical protein